MKRDKIEENIRNVLDDWLEYGYMHFMDDGLVRGKK
jgi:hypothetical protein